MSPFDPRLRPVDTETGTGDEATRPASSPEPDSASPSDGVQDATPHVAGDGGQPEGGDERDVQRDLEELTARAAKADEYLELAQRTKADFENYRKRATREAAAAQERGMAKLALALLPAVDNLDLALEAARKHSDSEDLVSGIKLVHSGVIAALARVGIEAFSPQGEPFDPQLHEAVAQQPVDGAEAGTVVEVYQRGYRLGDSVLRPARVVVAG